MEPSRLSLISNNRLLDGSAFFKCMTNVYWTLTSLRLKHSWNLSTLSFPNTCAKGSILHLSIVRESSPLSCHTFQLLESDSITFLSGGSIVHQSILSARIAATKVHFMLRPEAARQARACNLLAKPRTKKMDRCAMLRKVWKENHSELKTEILDWFLESLRRKYFESLWSQMQIEVVLEERLFFNVTVTRDDTSRVFI